jgi:hypothetical protein
MTELDPTQIIKDKDCIYFKGEKYQKVKELPRLKLENEGKFYVLSYNRKIYYRVEYPSTTVWWVRTDSVVPQMDIVEDPETIRLLGDMWFNDVKKGVIDEPQSKTMDEVMDRLIKKYQSQKLWNMIRDELGYSVDCCNEIVDLVEKWLPKEQSAAGSQNVDTELLVDGHNHCLQKMKEMLR